MTKTQWQTGDRIQCDLSFTEIKLDSAPGIPEGYIAGIASTPGTDRHGHKVLAKAFDESIKQKGLTGPGGVQLLIGHDWNKVGGKIKKLETVNNNLLLEAQLYLDVSYVKDIYTVLKHNGGLNFSVGFTLEEFEFNDVMEDEDDPWLIVQKGDLMEVSIVTFPSQKDAKMTFVKTGSSRSKNSRQWRISKKPLWPTEFCQSRTSGAQARRMGEEQRAPAPAESLPCGGTGICAAASLAGCIHAQADGRSDRQGASAPALTLKGIPTMNQAKLNALKSSVYKGAFLTKEAPPTPRPPRRCWQPLTTEMGNIVTALEKSKKDAETQYTELNNHYSGVKATTDELKATVLKHAADYAEHDHPDSRCLSRRSIR